MQYLLASKRSYASQMGDRARPAKQGQLCMKISKYREVQTTNWGTKSPETVLYKKLKNQTFMGGVVTWLSSENVYYCVYIYPGLSQTQAR